MASPDNIICSVCQDQLVENIAVNVCPDCSEAFCPQCLKFHSHSKSTRNHEVVDVCDYESFGLEIKTHCKEHQAKFQSYCMIHKFHCCSKCINTTHKSCNDVPSIDDVIDNAKSSLSLVDIEERLHQLRELFGQLSRRTQHNEKEITTECNIILEQIKQKRHSINQHLDQLEDAVVLKISEVESTERHHFQMISQELRVNEERVGTLLESVIKMKQNSFHLQTFRRNFELEKETRKTEETAEDLTKRLGTKSIIFQENSLLTSFESDVKSFGDVSVAIGQSKIFHVKQNDKHAYNAISKEKTFDDLCLHLIRPITIGTSTYYGCALLENGNTVFPNYHSKELIVKGCNSSTSYTITLPFNPYDVACIDEERVADTGGYKENKVYIVNLTTKVVERSINTYSGCCGICYTDGKLICSSNKGLIEVDLDTEKVTELHIGTRRGHGYVAVFGKRIYNAHREFHWVTCWDSNLQIIWTFKNKNVLRGPRGIAVDNQGNAYVGCLKTNNCVIISPHGQKYKQITFNEISQPNSLCFDHKKSHVLICGIGGPAGVFSVSL